MTPSDARHGQVKRRLRLRAMGLAPPETEDEIRRHLEECSECREEAARLSTILRRRDGSDTHLPESLVVRWASASGELRGLQREMVRRHLERCDSCRRDLSLLGHEPELPRVEALEPGPEVLALLKPEPIPPAPLPALVDARRAVPWRAWLQGGSLGGALAAAATVLIMMAGPLVQREPVPGAGGARVPPQTSPPAVDAHPSSARPGAEPPAPSPHITAAIVQPVHLSGGTRGETGAEVATLHLDAHARSIEFTAELSLNLEPGDRVRVWALAPDGTHLLDETHLAEALFGRPILRFQSDGPFPEGRYRVFFSANSGGEVQRLAYVFRVRRR